MLSRGIKLFIAALAAQAVLLAVLLLVLPNTVHKEAVSVEYKYGQAIPISVTDTTVGKEAAEEINWSLKAYKDQMYTEKGLLLEECFVAQNSGDLFVTEMHFRAPDEETTGDTTVRMWALLEEERVNVRFEELVDASTTQ